MFNKGINRMLPLARGPYKKKAPELTHVQRAALANLATKFRMLIAQQGKMRQLQ